MSSAAASSTTAPPPVTTATTPQTCGYIPALQTPYVCPDPGYICAVCTQASAAQCINSEDIGTPTVSGGSSIAPFRIGCLDYNDLMYGCDSACSAFQYRLTCSESATPYCGYYIFPYGVSMPACVTTPGQTYQVGFETIDGTTYGDPRSYLVLDQNGPLEVPASAQPLITTTPGAAASTTTNQGTSPASTSTPTPTSITSTATPTATSSSSSGLSSGAAAGIGVGVGIGVPLILGAIAFFFWRRRQVAKSKDKPYAYEQANTAEHYAPKQETVDASYLGAQPVEMRELPTDRAPGELGENRDIPAPAELSAER